jgi:hypothetical protein
VLPSAIVKLRMHPLAIELALALFLLGCGTAPSAAPSDPVVALPSGEPVGLIGYGTNGEMTCPNQWAQGSLRADVELKDRLLGNSQGPITIEIWPLDTVDWPAGIAPERFVALRWPLEYTGLRLAGGEVAVLDGAGNLVATTGTNYRLRGEWAVAGAIGGPLFGEPPWIDAFSVCRGSDSMIPQ